MYGMEEIVFFLYNERLARKLRQLPQYNKIMKKMTQNLQNINFK